MYSEEDVLVPFGESGKGIEQNFSLSRTRKSRGDVEVCFLRIFNEDQGNTLWMATAFAYYTMLLMTLAYTKVCIDHVYPMLIQNIE